MQTADVLAIRQGSEAIRQAVVAGQSDTLQILPAGERVRTCG